MTVHIHNCLVTCEKEITGFKLVLTSKVSAAWMQKKKKKKGKNEKKEMKPGETCRLKIHKACLIAQGGCGGSFSGDIQDPPGQGPLQPTVGDPASAGGLD